MTYKNSDGLFEILNKWINAYAANDVCMIESDVEKSVWQISEDQAEEILKILELVNCIYPLTELTSDCLEGKEICIFPERSIRLYPAANLLKDLNGLSVKAFLGAIRFNFDIMIMPEGFPCLPMEEHCMGMYVEGQWYHLEMKPDLYETSSSLPEKTDTEILARKLYRMIFRTEQLSDHIELLPGSMKAKDCQAIADQYNGAVFLFYPMLLSKLLHLIDQNKAFEQVIFDLDDWIKS